MADAREVLGEIQERVHRMVTPDGKYSPPDRYVTDAERRAGDWDCIAKIAGDLTGLVAALRAVLDLHIKSESHPKMCRACGYEDVPTCPTVRAITEALGGTDA